MIGYAKILGIGLMHMQHFIRELCTREYIQINSLVVLPFILEIVNSFEDCVLPKRSNCTRVTSLY